MAQYQLKMGASSDTGTLTWNANGSLRTLAITDGINSSNTQTCNYLYDDLGRIGLPPGSSGKSVDCGSTKWQQNFSFDPFGNITKTVPTGGTGLSFQPTYSTSTNRYTSLPGFTPTYDANGNLTADGGHTYSWDADGNPTNIDGNGIAYDALGRMAELSFTGGHDQWVYDPRGSKIAIMIGQTFAGAYIPLPGGGRRLYQISNGTVSGYTHPDWLGSSRLVTSDTKTLISDVAYAPYGEDYADNGAYLQFTWGNLGELTAVGTSGQGLFDFDFRKYRPAHGRWISPDPAGLAAANPTDPQSWNRYAYVGNQPLNTVDWFGLLGQEPDCDPFVDLGCGGCPPSDASCESEPPGCNPFFGCAPIPPPLPPIGGGGPGIGGGGASSGGGRKIGGKWPNGETLGLPSGLNLHPMTLADLISLSPSANCDWICDLIGTGTRKDPNIVAWIRFHSGLAAHLLDYDPGPPRLRRHKVDCIGNPCVSQNNAVIRAVPGPLERFQLCSMAVQLSMGGGGGLAPNASDQFPAGQKGTQMDNIWREYNPASQAEGNAAGNAAAYLGSLSDCFGRIR